MPLPSEGQSWFKRGRSFGVNAKLYDRVRPSYPVNSIRWTLGDESRTVVDLGAGTGILTRELVELGHRVTAVEPDSGMRSRLTMSSPTTTVLAGTAESIPLPDASVDAVLAGDAYHWFDPEPAHTEIARITRPGGVFGSLWKLRDESAAWSAELSKILDDEDNGVDIESAAAVTLHGALAAILGAATEHSGWLGNPTFGDDFGPVTWQAFRHAVPHSADTLTDLVKSRSYYLTASPQRQAELEHEVRQLATSHPALAGRSIFEVPYVTLVYRARRLPAT